MRQKSGTQPDSTSKLAEHWSFNGVFVSKVNVSQCESMGKLPFSKLPGEKPDIHSAVCVPQSN